MAKKHGIDPAVGRSLGESAKHNAEQRRLISDLARSRGTVVPEEHAPHPLPSNWQEELTPIQNDLEELKRQMGARPQQASHPEFSVRAPWGTGLRLAGIAGWQIAAVAISLGAIAAWAWVATHSITIATPVTLPAPAPRPS
jgi:hypothetical protein